MDFKVFIFFLSSWLVLLCIYSTEGTKECRANTEHHCEGSTRKQLTHLQICDGVKDCPGGEDEAHCGLPLVEGSVWLAETEFDNCAPTNKPDNVTFKIVHVDRSEPSYPEIKIKVTLTYPRTGGNENVIVGYSEGHYCYANRLLWVETQNYQGIIVRCCFDEGRLDECHGSLHTPEFGLTDWNPCGKFVYRRIAYEAVSSKDHTDNHHRHDHTDNHHRHDHTDNHHHHDHDDHDHADGGDHADSGCQCDHDDKNHHHDHLVESSGGMLTAGTLHTLVLSVFMLNYVNIE